MFKKIFLSSAEEVTRLLKSGKRVEGAVYIDKTTGQLTFKAYFRRPKPDTDDETIICQTPNGWLKETATRIKFFTSVKKRMGRRLIDVVMHRELKDAMSALEANEFIHNI